ncbi:MAG: hypothetical protein K5665_12190 [Saccharofermentans sp.]|nr:hypothetical protein [Saccharofermentans sp.]
MGLTGLRSFAVKAAAAFFATVVFTGLMSAYVNPVNVSADEDELYHSLYDVFKDRSSDPDNFLSQEDFLKEIFYNCERLKGIEYTYGDQEHYLACDGFVSLVFRLTFGTAHGFERNRTKYWCKFDYREEHIVADSYVDEYEVYRPGGTSVTWLYKHYVDTVVDSIASRSYMEGLDNDGWVEYLERLNVQPGDIMFWDNDKDRKYWSHIGIYAGIEDGVPMMWHSSAVKGKVVKQSLAEITQDIQILDYVAILPLIDRPVSVGLYVDDSAESEKAFSYSVYEDQACTEYLGRISSACELSEQSLLDNIPVYPNADKSAYERTIYVRRDMSPYNAESAEQIVYRIIIKVTPVGTTIGTLKYTIYGADDLRYYSGNEIKGFDYQSGGKVIPIKDFR